MRNISRVTLSQKQNQSERARVKSGHASLKTGPQAPSDRAIDDGAGGQGRDHRHFPPISRPSVSLRCGGQVLWGLKDSYARLSIQSKLIQKSSKKKYSYPGNGSKVPIADRPSPNKSEILLLEERKKGEPNNNINRRYPLPHSYQRHVKCT